VSPQPRARLLAASLYIGMVFHLPDYPRSSGLHAVLALPLALWIFTGCRTGQIRCLRFQPHSRRTAVGCVFAVASTAPGDDHSLGFWIGIYAAASPGCAALYCMLVFASACGLAGVLDAGTCGDAERASHFPRQTADTSRTLVAPWFMLIPMRGKLLPANGTGIELSVFIGPFLAFLIWRYRHVLREQLPREMKIRCLVVSVISIWLGMGSLPRVHFRLAQPIRLACPLPASVRSVSRRFWGFLALHSACCRRSTLALPVRERAHATDTAARWRVTNATRLSGSVPRCRMVAVRLHVQARCRALQRQPEHIEMMMNPAHAQPSLQGEFVSRPWCHRLLRHG